MLDTQHIQAFGELNFIKDPNLGYLLLKEEVQTTSLPSSADNGVLYELSDGTLFYSSSYTFYEVQPEVINPIPSPTPVKVSAPKEDK